MTKLIKTIRNRRRRAVGAIEYALLASFLSLGIVLGAKTLGKDIGAYFNNLGRVIAAWTTR